MEPIAIADVIEERLGHPTKTTSVDAEMYVLWFASLITFLAARPNSIPAVMLETESYQLWIHTTERTLILPGSNIFGYPHSPPRVTPKPAKMPSVAQLRPLYAPSLLWPTNHLSDSALDNWYEDNQASYRELDFGGT